MLTRVLRIVKDSLFPNKCLACGTFFHPDTENRQDGFDVSAVIREPIGTAFKRIMAPFLCPACLADFTPVPPGHCIYCGKAFNSQATDSHACGACIQQPPRCAHARAFAMYDGAIMALIHALKYNHRIQLAAPLGRLLFWTFMQYREIQAVDAVVPIPLHASRLKQRGFNQALLLVREWPCLMRAVRENGTPQASIDPHVLARKRKTISQTGLGRDQRSKNVKNAFQAIRPHRIEGKRLLLVDDVYTTGATAEECAGTLITHGAASVSVLTLARTD